MQRFKLFDTFVYAQVVAISSTEAKYQSLAQVTTKILWIQTILYELGVPFKTLVVFCDNQSVVAHIGLISYAPYKDITHGN